MGDKAAAAGSPSARRAGGPGGRRRSRRRGVASRRRGGRLPGAGEGGGGGGGQGISVARSPDELREAFAAAAREAEAAFGDPALYIEKLIESARHVEVQVLGEAAARCSTCTSASARSSAVARSSSSRPPRPSPADPRRDDRRRGPSRRRGRLRRGGHSGVPGRPERALLLHRDEHPPPGRARSDRDGHRDRPRARAAPHRRRRGASSRRTTSGSTAARSSSGSTPRTRPRTSTSPGRIDVAELPGGFGVRVDTAIYAGYTVVPFYDSLIAKLMVWAPTREQALRRGAAPSGSSGSRASRRPSPCTCALSTTSGFAAATSTGYLEQLLSEGAAGLAAQVSSVSRDGEAK